MRQLHLYGSGASAVASNSERRKKVKTKKGLEKIIKQNPKLEVVTTKEQMKRFFKKEQQMGMAEESEREFSGLMTP